MLEGPKRFSLKYKQNKTIYKCNIGTEFKQTVTHLHMFAILCVVSIIYGSLMLTHTFISLSKQTQSTRTQIDTDKQNITPTSPDFFAFVSLDPILYALQQQRCVRKCTHRNLVPPEPCLVKYEHAS